MEPNVWVTASDSFNSCDEVKWLSACSSGGCVEVGHDGDRVLVRDSKRPDGPVISYSAAEWNLILGACSLGVPFPVARTLFGGGYAWVGPNEDQSGLVTLEFDGDEMTAFLDGVEQGLFKPEVNT